MSTDVRNSTPKLPLGPRQKLLWGVYDFGHGHGLEIGPLHQSIVPRTHADVRYLDVFDRDTLIANYGTDPNVPPESIPEIDYALLHDGRVRSIPESVGQQAVFDWVMASHVVEHVPDVIAWLDQVAEVTKDGGSLVLAVPDRRYCFDLHRPGTSVGQMLQAHELGETVPSVRAVYDYSRGHASVRAPMVWSGNPVGYQNRIYDLDTVLERTERARSGEYIDSHVWLFTPGSFLEQIVELRAIGLCEWTISRLVPTPRDELEFYVVLTRLPRDRSSWRPELFADEPQPATMPDWLAESTDTVRELQATRDELEATRTTLARTEKQLRSAKTRERNRPAVRLRRSLRNSPAGPLLVRVANAVHARRR